MSYYVRVRGRVQGPFAVDQLRALIQKGQLSRIHELSQDQQSWSKVADFPELFATQVMETATVPASYSSPQESYQQPQQQVANPYSQSAPSAAEPAWYYSQHGNQLGPVPQSALTQMLSSGQLSPDSQVWTQGMGDWVRARQVPQFANAGPTQNPYVSTQNPYAAPQVNGFVNQHSPSGSDKLHPAVIQSITGSWIWVLYVVITCYLGLIGSFIWLLMFLVSMSRVGAAGGPVFTVMLTFFIFNVPLILVTIFSHRYLASISQFSRMPGEIGMIRVLACSRDYWRVIGGMACVYLVLVTLGLIFALAAGMDMALMR